MRADESGNVRVAAAVSIGLAIVTEDVDLGRVPETEKGCICL